MSNFGLAARRFRVPGATIWPDRSIHGRFASAVRRAGARNLVDELMDPVRVNVAAGDAEPGMAAALASYRARPFYTPAELAILWPMIGAGFAGTKGVYQPTAAVLRAALVRAKLPLLLKTGGSTWFQHNGRLQEFFICSDLNRWAGRPITQEQFDQIMRGS